MINNSLDTLLQGWIDNGDLEVHVNIKHMSPNKRLKYAMYTIRDQWTIGRLAAVTRRNADGSYTSWFTMRNNKTIITLHFRGEAVDFIKLIIKGILAIFDALLDYNNVNETI